MSYYVAGYIDAGYFEDEVADGNATPANSVSPATVSSSSATQTHVATPAHSMLGATVESSDQQIYQATPANCVGGALVSPSRAAMLSRELTFPVAYYPDTLQSAEYPVQ